MKSSSNLCAHRVFAAIAAIFTTCAHAILDTNNNGLSDLWEKQHSNGQLFSPTNPGHQPTADPDQDGWDNRTEAAAGTSPLLANPPEGIVATTVIPSATSGAYTLTWPTQIGKRYQLQASTDMESWLPVGDPITAENTCQCMGVNPIQPGSPIPPKLFWHVLIDDIDSDTDGLTNNEEHQLATDPNAPDSDGDGLLDGWEVAYGINPNDDGTVNVINGAKGDPDNDGAINSVEQNAGSSPTNTASTPSDIDGDGLLNEQDADPNKILIDWERAHEGSFLVIDLEMEPLTANSTQHGRSTVPAVLNDNNNISREPDLENGEKTPATWDAESLPAVWNPLANFSNASNAIETFDDFSLSFNNSQHTYHGLPLDDGSDDSPGIRAITVKWGGLNSAPSRYGDYSTQHTHRLVESRFNHLATEERIYPSGSTPVNITSTLIAPGFTITATSDETTDLPRIASFNFYSSAPHITRTGKILVHQNGGVKINDITPPSNIIYGITADPHDNTLVAVPGTAGGQSVSTQRHRCGNWELMPMPGIMDMNAGGVGITFPEHQVWRNGKTVNLDDLLSESGWENFKAEQINEKGTILGSATKIGQSEFLPVLLVPVELVPDYDRDCIISLADRGKVTKGKPWRFWVNDDDDSGETGGSDISVDDVEGSSEPDYKGNSVDGIRDLIDFFPLHLDLKDALELMPETEFQYFLKHASQTSSLGGVSISSFNVLWYPEAILEGDPAGETGAGSYYKNLDKAADIASRPNYSISVNGLRIPNEMLLAAKEGKGVALVEARHATDNPIKIEIRKNDGTFIGKVNFPVRISSVKDMLRYRFVMPGAADLGSGDVPGDPPNWPDADRNNKHFIFVHGYNVNDKQSKGWAAEAFKRMFWSGSNARFSAFAWYGYESQIENFPGVGNLTPNYQANLDNAFGTAKSFKQFFDLLKGEKTVAAHSMGNVLVGSAMHDWGARPANFLMLDAAAAKEAFDATEVEDAVQDQNMVHPAWKDYPKPLRASEWHERVWPDGDQRGTLTWRGRLKNVIENGGLTNVYNFYSSGEEVLNNPDTNNPELDTANPFNNGALPWAKANKTWAMQEKRKGLGISGYIHTSNYGGWAANLDPYDPSIHVVGINYWRMKYPNELPQIPSTTYFQFLTSLRERPFFDASQHTILFDEEKGAGSPGSNHARDHRNTLIAEMIPCTTFAAGRNAFINENTILPERNIDMNADMKTDPGKWPLSNAHDLEEMQPRPWLHSDVRDKAFTHNWKVYEKFVEIGNLNQSL